jgi:hypothetical protein
VTVESLDPFLRGFRPLKATFRLVTTLIALAFAWGLAYAALGVHVGLAVLPGLVAVGLLVGVFIVERVGRLCAFVPRGRGFRDFVLFVSEALTASEADLMRASARDQRA